MESMEEKVRIIALNKVSQAQIQALITETQRAMVVTIRPFAASAADV